MISHITTLRIDAAFTVKEKGTMIGSVILAKNNSINQFDDNQIAELSHVLKRRCDKTTTVAQGDRKRQNHSVLKTVMATLASIVMSAFLLFQLSNSAMSSTPTGLPPETDKQQPKIQLVINKGPVLKLIASCNPGEGIISYSKYDSLYCTPDAKCFGGLRVALEHLCNPVLY